MISVTMLSSYLYCQRKLWLSQVLGLKEPLNGAMVIGNLAHKSLHFLNLAEQELVSGISDSSDFESIMSSYASRCSAILKSTIVAHKRSLKQVGISLTEAFSRVWPLLLAESNLRSERLFAILLEKNAYGDELWAYVHPKIRSEYSITSETLGLRGIIDVLEVHNDKLVPVELKTGKIPSEGVWPAHRIQVGAYALMLENKFDISVEKAVVRYLESGDEHTIALNPFLRQEILELRDMTIRTLAMPEPPAHTRDRHKCESCAFRSQCYNEDWINGKSKDLNNAHSIVIP